MGQYHKVVNLDKKQVLHPHEFTDGLKLLEFGSGGLTMTGLAVLLACSNNRGGGDLNSDNKIIGSWAGDHIAIIGDYAEPDDFEGLTQEMIDGIWGGEDGDPTWADISKDVIKAICEDRWLREDLLKSVTRYDWGRDWSWLFTKEEFEAAKKANDKPDDSGPSLRPDMVISA